jgi:hypothetical protein
MESAEAYEILGVSRGASKEEIRSAYLRLSRQVHSDTGGSDGLFRQVKMAYDTLSDPATETRSDNSRDESQSSHAHREETRHSQHWDSEEPSSPLRHWVRANPSMALLLGGVFALIFSLKVGASVSFITLLGAVTVILGTAGLMGVKRAAVIAQPHKGLALLKSQLRVGFPQLIKKSAKVILVLIAVLVALGVAKDHSVKRRRRA